MTDREQIKLVVSFLKKPELRGYARRLGYDEALQEGFVGFLEGMKNYDPAKGAISTKTWKSVFGEVTLAYFKRLQIRIPKYLFENTEKLKNRKTSKKTLKCIEQSQKVKSWEQQRIGDGFDYAVEMQTESDIQEGIEENRRIVDVILSFTNEKEIMVLKRYYGIDMKQMSTNEISKELSIDAKHVDYVRSRAIKRLKKSFQLADF